MAASNEWQVLTESHGHLPHLLVIPENAANRDIVAGFRNHLSVDFRRIQVVNVAGGWKDATNKFVGERDPCTQPT
jgi:hypothetical protein